MALWKQRSETDRARLVLVHEPCVANFMGSLHPDGSLYARPVNTARARKQHQNFRKTIEEDGTCKTISVREILEGASHGNRAALEQLAASSLEYVYEPNQHTFSSLPPESIEHLVSDAYKRECLSRMSPDQLVEVVLTRPRVVLTVRAPEAGKVKATETEVVRNEFRPLSNLIFTRDVAVVTAAGPVLTRPAIESREAEIRIAEFCMMQMKVPFLGRIESPGRLEGGDLLPAGEICFVGTGLRSNQAAVDQMMESDWFGCDRIAVVKDQIDMSQERMHLDTVFNIVSDSLAIVDETLLGKDSSRRRDVDEYRRDGPNAPYVKVLSDIELGEYLTRYAKYSVIPVSEELQNKFNACNILNLGEGRVLVSSQAVADKMRDFPVTPKVVEFDEICAMYGSLHCASQVLQRELKIRSTPIALINSPISKSPIVASESTAAPPS